MIDREKVITGLVCCQKTHCDKCPYVYDGLCNTNDCTADLASDVLELLKEQEAEIERLKRPDCEHAEHDGIGCLCVDCKMRLRLCGKW